jgi:hypothetical protein
MYPRHLQALLAGVLLLLLGDQALGCIGRLRGPGLPVAPPPIVLETMFVSFAEPPIPTLADEELLKKNKVPTDGPGLLDYLRKRALGPEGEARLRKLVKDLGDDDFETRENATQDLIALGPRARPAVRGATTDPDLEVRRRAAIILTQIDKGADNALRITAAAVRLLARRKPAGAVEALFAYLPSAEDESIAEEVRLAVEALAMRDGKIDPVLVAGLKDKSALKRAAAGVILCRARARDHFPEVRKLLADPDMTVRFPVALALAAAREKDAVTALLDSMDRLGAKERSRLEDLLYRLANGAPPDVPAGTDDASRRRARRAWQAWWKSHRAGIDADRLAESAKTLGFTTVVLLDQALVMELDGSNRPRWQVNGLQTPLDVQRLPGERVLLAEYGGNRVTERNTRGEVVWEKKIDQPLAAQRLANGNTFIATRTGTVEVDRTGKELSSYHRPFGETIMRARKLANGDMVLVTQLGVARCVRIDKMGREVKSFGVEVATSGGRIDVLPNGHVLVPELGNDRVVERDADGKMVRAVKVVQPITASYLPNGHWLVTSMHEKRATEIDRSGKEVWEYKRETRVTRAVRP